MDLITGACLIQSLEGPEHHEFEWPTLRLLHCTSREAQRSSSVRLTHRVERHLTVLARALGQPRSASERIFLEACPRLVRLWLITQVSAGIRAPTGF